MEKQRIGELLQWGKSQLRETKLRTPDLDAEVLLMEVLNAERVVLHVYPEREVEPEQLEAYKSWIRRRKKEEPLHYITGKKEFMGLELHVEKGVLIPRGDTEVVVEAGIEILKKIAEKKGFQKAEITEVEKASRIGELRALDIGVGSGAIAVSLLHYVKNLYMVGTDVSDTPLTVTEINAEKHQVAHRLGLFRGSLFEPVNRGLKPEEREFDLIISNPPYIPYEGKDGLDREVKDHEPEEALFAKDQGLYYYRKIAEEAPAYLKKDGYLIFEIGWDQGISVRRIVEQAGFTGAYILKDLENRDRVVIGKR
ncbi:peptide chain release factor N(5)-glutamine methyltransferase [Isachenkonia alkalipeptolytica]|uniref:Release factor glutamine methyltransferase n=1 Tax=Isachenkonia alkalipeptolytica TaxID=2565777 RepID=A0AA43XLA2_9CLOT|nr:peptide chain release factor N(5)-glutamine methyltransferase [Isachenkonia alkalipeptolytica]NBG88344.1 peptide chain release factor N(5)-glutamine methyltransferase [Isachenkonia alkalipeptolytica]